MPWVVCPRCHFSQMPAERCRRCGESLAGVTASAERPEAAPPAAPPDSPAGRLDIRWVAAGTGAAVLVLLVLMLRPRSPSASAGPAPAETATPAALDLSGRWKASISKSIGSEPPRPVLKEVAIETDRAGNLRGARVVFTDPGRGGAGAGYRTVEDGPRRLSEAFAAVSPAPSGATLAIDFLDLPGWVPDRSRLWRVLEGGAAAGTAPRYLLVESLETDYLIQAGINASGFLSYAFFSPAYAPARGRDELSRVIHPEPGASLAGFRNVVWDLSGAADFLTLKLPVTVSGPEGGPPDRAILVR